VYCCYMLHSIMHPVSTFCLHLICIGFKVLDVIAFLEEDVLSYSTTTKRVISVFETISRLLDLIMTICRQSMIVLSTVGFPGISIVLSRLIDYNERSCKTNKLCRIPLSARSHGLARMYW